MREYIVFCYNMLTLTRSIYYADNVWGRKHTHIYYSDVFSKLPPKIKKDYSISVISRDGLDKERGVRAIIDSCLWTRDLCEQIEKTTSNYDDITLVIFRDNELQEASLIDHLKHRCKCSIQICLFEEGAGLYAKSKAPTRYRSIKRVIYSIFRLSKYSLLDRTQGLNENVNVVICNKPEEYLAKRTNDNGIIVEKMENVFTQELSEYITESIIENTVSTRKYDFVFLTQPFTNFRDDIESLNETYEVLLPKIFSILSQRGEVLIKLHPREEYNYSKFANEHIFVSTEQEKSVPFECLMTNYGYPQMVSMFSSVSFNISTTKPSIFLYKLFRIPHSASLFNEDDLAERNIIVCHSIEEFDEVINNDMKGRIT